ncbi:hypothetical protein ACW9HQ_44665, partial [Nocardia gipuzkoensis]
MNLRRLPVSVAAVSIPLLWSNRVLPRLGLGIRGRTAANATFATAYALAFGRGVQSGGARRGVQSGGARRGVQSGGACPGIPLGRPARRPLSTFGPAAAVVAGYGVALAIPALRA